MKSKILALRIAGVIFGLIAIVHLVRIIMAIPITVGGHFISRWCNLVGLLIAGALCIWLCWLSMVKTEK